MNLQFNKNLGQQIVGALFFLPLAYLTSAKLLRLRRVFKNYNHYLTLSTGKINYQHFIERPNQQQYVILSNFTCSPSPDLFKVHMKMIDNYQTEAAMSNSYCQKTTNFSGEVTDSNNKKLKVLCNCSSNSIFVSSSVLCNILSVLRNHLKQKPSMLVYGEMKYDKQLKQLVMRPESIGTNREEISNAWNWIFTVSVPLYMFFSGLGIGLGSCLLLHHQEQLEQYALLLKQKIIKTIETLQQQ